MPIPMLYDAIGFDALCENRHSSFTCTLGGCIGARPLATMVGEAIALSRFLRLWQVGVSYGFVPRAIASWKVDTSRM